MRTLEERLLETKGQLSQAVAQNEKLSYTLREARDHIAALREEVDKLTQPPAAYATLLSMNDDGTVDIVSSGRKMRVEVSPSIEAHDLRCGVEVVLNESFTVVMVRSQEIVRRGRHHPRGAERRPPRPHRRSCRRGACGRARRRAPRHAPAFR